MATEKEVLDFLERSLSRDAFAEIKSSEFLDRFDYSKLSYENNNMFDVVDQYEKETGEQLSRFN